MVPHVRVPERPRDPAPRARGDGPTSWRSWTVGAPCSPRTRGWSRDVVLTLGLAKRPFCSPRTRGWSQPKIDPGECVNTCSPRTRGWSPLSGGGGHQDTLLPAHAGMVPEPGRGWRPASPAPRARGDGPDLDLLETDRPRCSPRTRGWSPRRVLRRTSHPLLPANAGMVSPPARPRPWAALLPALRGWALVTGPVRTWPPGQPGVRLLFAERSNRCGVGSPAWSGLFSQLGKS